MFELNEILKYNFAEMVQIVVFWSLLVMASYSDLLFILVWLGIGIGGKDQFFDEL